MILYTTLGCHLCDQAADLLNTINQSYIPTEIGDDDVLLAEYGIRIPVIATDNGNTLDWPFTQAELLTFISENV